MTTVEKIPLDGVTIGDRLRPADETHVSNLARSMAEIGLKTPITVRLIDYNTSTEKCVLVSGLHRFLAAQRLGWDEIECFIVDVGDLEADLLEIVENLDRIELTALEKAHHIAEAVRIREAIARRDAEVSRQPDAKPNGGRPQSGTRATARDLGMPEATVRRALKVDGITDAAKAAAAEAGLADNQAALLQVAQREPDEQVAAVAEIIEKKSARPKPYGRLIDPKIRALATRHAKRIADRKSAKWLEDYDDAFHDAVVELVKARRS